MLNMYTLRDFLEDDPTNDSLGWVGVFVHEMAHLTENYNIPDTLIDMFELMLQVEADSLLKIQIKAENDYLLKAIDAQNSGNIALRNQSIEGYFVQKSKRTTGFDSLTVASEAYYEFVEGY